MILLSISSYAPATSETLPFLEQKAMELGHERDSLEISSNVTSGLLADEEMQKTDPQLYAELTIQEVNTVLRLQTIAKELAVIENKTAVLESKESQVFLMEAVYSKTLNLAMMIPFCASAIIEGINSLTAKKEKSEGKSNSESSEGIPANKWGIIAMICGFFFLAVGISLIGITYRFGL